MGEEGGRGGGVELKSLNVMRLLFFRGKDFADFHVSTVNKSQT